MADFTQLKCSAPAAHSVRVEMVGRHDPETLLFRARPLLAYRNPTEDLVSDCNMLDSVPPIALGCPRLYQTYIGQDKKPDSYLHHSGDAGVDTFCSARGSEIMYNQPSQTRGTVMFAPPFASVNTTWILCRLGSPVGAAMQPFVPRESSTTRRVVELFERGGRGLRTTVYFHNRSPPTETIGNHPDGIPLSARLRERNLPSRSAAEVALRHRWHTI